MSESQSNQTNSTRPTLCRSCGSIVGAGQANCAVCGATTSASIPSSQTTRSLPDRETIRFARAVLDRPHKFTIVLLVANLFVFLLMWESSGLTTGVLWNQFPEPVLIAYGAKVNSLIHAPNREWWRFVTPMFVHVNVFHLLVNMYSLWIVGPYVEKLYGSAKFVVLWVLTGIAGVFASYITLRPAWATGSFGRFIFKAEDVPSAGASGALFGLVGVLFIFGLKYRSELPEGFKRAFGTGMLPVILINLFIGYIERGLIDNAAHLGGLVSGAALAAVISYRRLGDRVAINVTWRVLQIAALALVVLSFFKVRQKINFYLNAGRVTPIVIQAPSTFLVYVSVMTQAQEKISAILYERDMASVQTVSANLAAVAPPDEVAGELRDRLLKILSTATAQQQQGSNNQSPDQKINQKLVDDYNAWQKDYAEWLKKAVASNQVK